MPETAQTGKSKLPAAITKLPPAKHGPKRFDPSEHGGVKRRGWLFLFCGVILPAVAMLFETNFHFCARHFFDPFPSAGHVVLFALIPFSNFLVWLGTRRDLSSHYAFMSLISGMAMGVACLYTLMFLPLTPMACLFSLALGFGLLGLAPLLSMPCNWISGRTVCHLAARKITYFNAHQVEHLGHMIILVMVIAIELPSTLTRINLARAAEVNPVASRDGVAWLRRFGSQEVLLRACYERSGRATDILGSLYESANPLTVDHARRVFYQVTGKPFNSVPIPRSARATIQHTGVVDDPSGLNAGVEDEFDVDTDIAGEAVSGVARGLSLSQSKFVGKIDPDAALASLDWSFAFTNDSKFDREARAKILLPAQAVVTRATLTVNNVERDATIMVRSAARARYRQAVVEHKDPLLVSTCGADQLLVQCFPVRPGETMKVKLQIVAPMGIDQKDQAVLLLPAFLERNFQVELPNDVDIQSPKSLSATGLTAGMVKAKDGADVCHLTGAVDAVHLAGFSSIVKADRDKSCQLVWCKTDKLPGGAEVERIVAPPVYGSIRKLIVVVDGSSAMQQFMPQIAEGLKALPQAQSAQIKVVGDQVLDLGPVRGRVVGDVKLDLGPVWEQGGSREYTCALESLKNFKGVGGQDDFTALDTALTQASVMGDTAVLWIHTAQPVTSGTSFGIKANLDRAAGRPLLFDMQLVAGPNEILNGIDSHAGLVRVPRTGALTDDLSALFGSFNELNGAGPAVAPANPPQAPAAGMLTARALIQGYQMFQGLTQVPAGREVDGRLAQIWANRQICMDMENPDPGQRNQASMLANVFQIVSPVSSAIVTQPVAETLATDKGLTNNKRDLLGSIGVDQAYRGVQQSIVKAKKQIVDQLNSLSSASLSSADYKQSMIQAVGPAAQYPSADMLNKSLEARMATAPAGDEAASQVNTAGTVRQSQSGAEMVASNLKDAAQFQWQKGGPPELQGATNGTIGPAPQQPQPRFAPGGPDAFSSLGGSQMPPSAPVTSGGDAFGSLGGSPVPSSAPVTSSGGIVRHEPGEVNDPFATLGGSPVSSSAPVTSSGKVNPGSAWTSRENYFLRFPVAYEAYHFDKRNNGVSQGPGTVPYAGAPVGDDSAVAPPAKIVPEAGTWLLLLVIAILLGVAWFFKSRLRRRTK